MIQVKYCINMVLAFCKSTNNKSILTSTYNMQHMDQKVHMHNVDN